MIESMVVRPFDPADTTQLRELYAQSIEYLTTDDYNEDQRFAWLSFAADAEAFKRRLWDKDTDTFVVEVETEHAGFATLKDDVIDMLYVHPYYIRQGVAGALIDTIERLARDRKIDKLRVEASDTAKPFFESRGYIGENRNLVPRDDQWLSNTTMTKDLGPAQKEPLQ